ncbi:hypothetical protein BBOV_II002010 [Babesia bovis T2Bo]|uniref:Uncharacterized protein n=1 Tax=Babesia bovis TaxID=5865 RepID=A7AT96_BABBO|nr:hypothetical protein BBOV_II002010 [Babesia bovis T2Bo]EDO06157.1 hypothetical protein BBOV_II002010 [Babesia bovis T2Bo]|eukprot:XP_001609725.1 hypothetical protein [Babesia bovis T2Bo]
MVMLAVFASVIWALVRSTVASSTISKSCMEGSIDVCKNLFTPTIMYDITDVAKIGNKVNVTFKFVLPTPLKTGLGAQEMKLVLLPPNGLVFNKSISMLSKGNTFDTKQLEALTKDTALDYYSEVDQSFDSGKCKKPHFVEMLTNVDKSFQKDLNIYFEESITKHTAGCSAGYKDLRKFAILDFQNVTNLEAGEYNWTGEFTYDDKYAKAGCEEDGVYWTVGFLQDLEETTMNIDVKPLCINTDFLSAKRFFENAKSMNAKVLACHGKRLYHKNLFSFLDGQSLLDDVEFVYVPPPKGPKWILSYHLPWSVEKEDKFKNGYTLAIYLNGIKRGAIGLYNHDTVKNNVSVVRPKDIRKDFSYDGKKHIIYISFQKYDNIYTHYEIQIDLKYLLSRIDLMGTIDVFFLKNAEKQISKHVGYDTRAWIASKKQLFPKNVKETVINECTTMLTDIYSMYNYKELYGYTLPVLHSKTLQMGTTTSLSEDSILYRYEINKYLLIIELFDKDIKPEEGGFVIIKVPDIDYVLEETFTNIFSWKNETVYLNQVYQYNQTGEIKVVLNRVNGLFDAADYKYYHVIIPFKSSKTPQDIISMEGWGIHIFQKDTYKGYIPLKIRIDDKAKLDTDTDTDKVKRALHGNVGQISMISTTMATKLVIPITSIVYRYMSFVFKFDENIPDILYDVTVISKASLRVKHVWDSMKKQLTIYVYNLESYIGKREQMTFVLDIMDSEKNVKNYGSLKIKAIGNDDGPILKSLVDIVAKFSDLKHDSDELALGNEVTLRGFTKSTEMDKICFSKQPKVESISFKDNTKGVYFMTRVHDCSEPWLPPKISNLDHLSLKIAQSGLPKNTGVHYTYRTVYQLKSLDDGPSHDELAAMQSKRFMQHTLHILFSDAACKLLSEIYKTQGKSGLDGFKAIEEFMKEVPSDWVPNVFGDIIFSYHDSKTSILHKKRKVMYVESGDIKNDEEKIERIYTFSSAFENVLSDGLGGMEADSLNESFSVIGFMNDKDLQHLWISYKPYEEKQQFPLSATYKQPIMVKGYVFNDKPLMDKSWECLIHPFAYPLQPSKQRLGTNYVSWVLFHEMVNNTSPKDSAVNILNYVINATKVVKDKKVSSTMNAEIIKKKRVEKSDAVDIFIQFYKQTAPHCTTKGNIFQLLVHQFMLDIYETIARQPIIVAACMSFDDGDEHKASGKTYGLSYKGKEVLEGEDKTAMPGSIGPSVHETCNFASLQKYLPKTLYHDKSIDYKDYIFQTDQTEVKSLSDAKKMLVSDVKSVPAKTAPSVSSGYGQLGLEEMFGK